MKTVFVIALSVYIVNMIVLIWAIKYDCYKVGEKDEDVTGDKMPNERQKDSCDDGGVVPT